MTIRVEGLKDLEAALFEMKTATAKSLGRRVLKAAGEPVAAKANANAPDGPTGKLSESYTVSTRLNRAQRREARRVGPDEVLMFIGTNDAAGVQQEFGNARHGAQPHFRPAWDAEAQPTLERVADGLAVEVEKAAARARRKSAKGR